MRTFTLTLCTIAVSAVALVYAGDHPEKTDASAQKKADATTTAAASTEQMVMAEVDKAAPNFTLTSSIGNKHSLSDFKGKTVVLEWTNYDCPFVKKFYGANAMQKWQDAYTKKGVVWLSICSSADGKEGFFDTKTVATRMKDAKAAPTAYLMDADGTVGRMYGAKTTPHMFVINPEGVLVYAGAIDSKRSTDAADIAGATNYVAAALDAIMAGKPVETKTSTPYGCSVKYATPAVTPTAN